MKKHLILLIFLNLIFTSCGNMKTKDAKSDIRQEFHNQNLKSSTSFDWTKAADLKDNMIYRLESKNESTDRVIINFLNEYSKLTEEINEEINDESSCDSLSTLLYDDDALTSQCAKDFKKKVEENGYKIAFTEGMVYVGKNTDFIKSRTVELIDSISIQFLNLYCAEIDAICCEDAGLVISIQELANRVYKWGELIDMSRNLEYCKIAEDEFTNNLSLLYTGIDNTPAYDWETNKYNEEFLDAMNVIIELNPNSKAAREFYSYIEILKSENFERTVKVDVFLNEKFK